MKLLSFYLIIMLIGINASAQDNEYKTNDSIGRAYEVKQGQNIEDFLEKLNPRDTLLIHEGIYKGRLVINNSGTSGHPIVIRGYGHGEERPELFYEGSGNNLLRITGNNLILDYLKFYSKHSYGMRIGNTDTKRTNNITIQNCIFYECGGGDISANYYHVSYDSIRILNNFFDGSKRTPVYIGSHPGGDSVTHFVFKGNVIDGSQNDGPESTVGYGIELKLNVTKSIVENNFFTGTKGPGIMVYGADNMDTANANIVRGNVVALSRHEAGIVIGGGPSIVRDNLIINCKYGMYIQNYAGRNLLDNIVIKENTILDYFGGYGISYDNVKGVTSAHNLVISKKDEHAFINPGPGPADAYSQPSKTTDSLVDQVINVVPERDNLPEIWKKISSGPLKEQEVNEVMNLILEHSKPVKVVHSRY